MSRYVSGLHGPPGLPGEPGVPGMDGTGGAVNCTCKYSHKYSTASKCLHKFYYNVLWRVCELEGYIKTNFVSHRHYALIKLTFQLVNPRLITHVSNSKAWPSEK